LADNVTEAITKDDGAINVVVAVKFAEDGKSFTYVLIVELLLGNDKDNIELPDAKTIGTGDSCVLIISIIHCPKNDKN